MVTLTEAGKLIKRATAGTPEGIANPVNPWTIKILEAIKKVGTLYVKDRKIRIEPENWKQIKKLSGLSEEEIEKQLVVMKQARFLGENSLFESGLLLLEAAELMKKSMYTKRVLKILEEKSQRYNHNEILLTDFEILGVYSIENGKYLFDYSLAKYDIEKLNLKYLGHIEKGKEVPK